MKRTNLTQTGFNTIHSLIELNVKVSTIAKIVGKSTATVYTVRQFKTMPEYLAHVQKKVKESLARTSLKKRHPLLVVGGASVSPMRMQTNVDPSPFMSIGDEVREIHAKVKKLLDLMTP